MGKVQKDLLNAQSFKIIKDNLFLSFDIIISMIVSQNLFGQMQRQPFLSDAAFCSHTLSISNDLLCVS